METITKERAARCDRATPARKTSPPAGGSRTRSITQKRRRAKYRHRRIALLLTLMALVAGAVYAIAGWATGYEPPADQKKADAAPAVQPIQLVTLYETAPPQTSAPTTRYALTDAERDLVERVVMAEAGGESFEGQMLVAQCILNAAEKTGTAPSEVVTTYQYTSRRPDPTQSVKDAVVAVFDSGETVTDELILYFYNPAIVTSTWHESQIFVTEVGGHRFFAERSSAK